MAWAFRVGRQVLDLRGQQAAEGRSRPSVDSAARAGRPPAQTCRVAWEGSGSEMPGFGCVPVLSDSVARGRCPWLFRCRMCSIFSAQTSSSPTQPQIPYLEPKIHPDAKNASPPAAPSGSTKRPPSWWNSRLDDSSLAAQHRLGNPGQP